MIFLLLLGNWSNLVAGDCNQPELKAAYEQLRGKVDAHEAVTALAFADSLLQLMENEKVEHCYLYLWIQYEKGEALELLRDRSKEALNIYYKLVKEAEKTANWELMAQVYISIARIHEIIGRPKDCLRNLKTAREIIEQHRFPAVFSRFAVRYASYHRIFNNRDTARVYAMKAIKYGRQYKVQRSELDGNLLMGILTKDVKKSVHHFQEAIKICLERKDFYGVTFQGINIARRYTNIGNFEKAMQHLNMGSSYAGKILGNSKAKHTAYQYLYEQKSIVFEAQGKLDSALFYARKSAEARGRANIQINQEEISKKEMAFAIEKEQAKLQYEKEQSLYLRLGFFVLSVLLGFMIIAFLKNENKKRFIAKQNALIAKKNKELTEALRYQSLLLSEVHHRVKNNLQLVMSMLTLKGHKIPEMNVQAHFTDLSNKVYSIALIHEQLYNAKEFEKINLNDYIQELLEHYKKLQNNETAFSFQLETNQVVFLNLATVLPLGIICSELISNSLKYARMPDRQLSLHLHIKKTQDYYHFLYEDNGPGYPSKILKHKNGSMGKMLISSMVKQLQAKSNTSNREGAVFTLVFKEKSVSVV